MNISRFETQEIRAECLQTICRLEIPMDDFLPPPNRLILRRSTGAVTYRCCNAVKDVPKERFGEYQSSTPFSLMVGP